MPIAQTAARFAQRGTNVAERVISASIAHRPRTSSMLSRWFGTTMGGPVRASTAADGAAALAKLGGEGGCPFRGAAATVTALEHGASGSAVLGQIGEHMTGVGIGKRRIAMTAETHGALNKSARDALAEVFAPVGEDIHRGVQELLDTPLGELEMAGSEPYRARYEVPAWKRYLQMRTAVSGSGRHMDRTDEMVQSDLIQFHAPNKPPVDVVVPLGEYGEPMARAIAQSARAINGMILRDISPAVEALGAKHPNLMRNWTFMDDMNRTVIEGTNSFAGVAGLLTRKRVPGMSGAELLERISADGLFAKVAAEPNGISGPFFFSGYGPKTSVEMGARGRLVLSKHYEAIVKATTNRRAGIWNRPSLGARFDRGCPLLKVSNVAIGGGEVARRNYIRALGADFIALTQRFYERELALAAQGAT